MFSIRDLDGYYVSIYAMQDNRSAGGGRNDAVMMSEGPRRVGTESMKVRGRGHRGLTAASS